MFTLIVFGSIIIISCCSISSTLSQGPDNIFEILPSTKIVIDKEDDIMVTCRYNGDCDASLYKKGDSLNPVKQLKRSKKKQSNITKSTKELTWKFQKFQMAYGGIYVCELIDCNQSANNNKKSFEIQVKAPSSPGIQLLDDRLKKVTVHFNTSFRLKLTGSPMPNMRCMLHNGEELIFCSLKDMKKVMYDNPSRPCNSSDLHYQIRSEKLQTADVGFHIINVTFARDNGSTIYCYWKYDNGTEKNISMQIVVIDKIFQILSSTKIVYKGGDVTVTCRYNGDCDASLYQTGPLKLEQKRSNIRNNSIKELTYKYGDVHEAYGGIYFCELTNCFQPGNNGKKRLKIEIRDKPIIHSTDHSTNQVTKGDSSTDKPIIITEGDNDNTAIIAIVIGCVLLLLLIGVMVGTVFYCRERKLKNTYKTHLHSSGLVDPNKPLNEQMHELTYDKDWEFPFKLLGLYTTCLGEGNFGKVVIGKAYNIELLDPRNKSQQAKIKRNQLWKSSKKRDIQTNASVSPTYVAVKTVKDGAPLEETRNLIGELKLMMHIGEHEHIVNLLGVTYKGYKLRGILEYCPHGDLRKFLWQKRSSYQQTWVKTNHNEDKRFTLADQVTIAKQVAEGMQFLSSKKCVHRDLAARNILLAENYVVKIADFGIARKVAEDYTYHINRRNVQLPFKWMAIESWSTGAFTQKSDVWSFGILLWEIMTLGDVPYDDTVPYDEIKTFLNTGKRLDKPDNCTDELYGIMLDCWKRLPECRPSFKDIHETLRRLLVIKLSALDFEENMDITDFQLMQEENNVDQRSRLPGNSYITISQMRETKF